MLAGRFLSNRRPSLRSSRQRRIQISADLSPWQKEAESKILPQMTVSTENYNRLVRMIQQGEKLKMTVNVEAQYHRQATAW